LACACALAVSVPLSATAAKGGNGKGKGRGHVEFTLEEATITDIHTAIQARKLTVTQLVEMYLDRIKAYNGTCVNEPEGILGPITMKPHAGKVNAIMTLNLRPAARQAWGFDARKARSITDPVDDDPTMPDALETAAALDAQFAKTGKLAGPLHGVVFAIKDQYDTRDMRTTSGADAFWANDRPPDDRRSPRGPRAGARSSSRRRTWTSSAAGARSSYGGTGCNAYDTERDPGGSMAARPSGVAPVTRAIAEIVAPSSSRRGASVVGLPTRAGEPTA
jgi:Asp-tRNA(Asn)/Glu-tRNA(Gln) amidotransferase A subunit family amidase